MAITIPAASLTGGTEVTVTANANAKFAITAADAASATVGDVTVEGTVNQAITDAEVTITLANDTFKAAMAANDDVSGWFNLPAGLTATVKTATEAEATSVTVTIAGTPTAASTDAMAITIPADNLTGSKAVTVTENTNAKFAITEVTA